MNTHSSPNDAARILRGRRRVKGNDFTARGKTLKDGGLVTGHDFSRADTSIQIRGALAPEGFSAQPRSCA